MLIYTSLGYLDCGLRPLFDHLFGHLATNGSYFPLEITHSSLFGIAADDLIDGAVREVNVFWFQSIGVALFLDEKLFGNVEFVEFGVSRQPNDLHAIL